MLKKVAGSKRKAQSLVEYGLILALVSIIAIAVLNTMGGKIKDTITKVNSQLSNASQITE